jgi:hypothetical protein
MPAIPEDADWGKWLGEEVGIDGRVKTAHRTMEGVNWQMAKEPKAPKKPKS